MATAGSTPATLLERLLQGRAGTILTLQTAHQTLHQGPCWLREGALVKDLISTLQGESGTNASLSFKKTRN
jgi:hypothetical protein